MHFLGVCLKYCRSGTLCRTTDNRVFQSLTTLKQKSVLICTFHYGGQGLERKGEGQYQQTWWTRSENIHFTLKIMHIIGQNKLLWDHLTSGKSAPN